MTQETLHRFVCWDQQPLADVINKEAVSVDRTLFLATHAPFQTIVDLKSRERPYSEDQLLTELVKRSTDDRHTFLVMQGIPGTGKSHLIRWLRERYLSEYPGQDEVLLIKRADSSLRQTLIQIINADSFEGAQFQEQLQRLESATQQLSDESLADTIINNLQVGTQEISTTVHPRIERYVEVFLLDIFVRKEMKRPGRAVDRLRQFLSGTGKNLGLRDGEYPQFSAEDFDFGPDVLLDMRRDGSHVSAHKLAESLNLKASLREELAQYLNQLLPFVIERTSALSASDLKRLFLDLRRELHQQGKGLALFIEDISVFTGLDAGLIDVLVTQHTGESADELCRMTSVVGITDAYYKDFFPDNIKERITHHFSLNREGAQRESGLLATRQAVADLVARYLNVLRLKNEDLERWVARGADPTKLPSGCEGCAFREQCHEAFGARALSTYASIDTHAGLYPFNEQALWQLYNHLDTSKVSKTPRTLLGSIVEHILSVHTSQVRNGTFPPPITTMVSDLHPPTLDLTQRNIMSNKVDRDVQERLQSLVLLWGNGTVHIDEPDGERLVGGLPRAVFDAYGLPFDMWDTTSPSPPPGKNKKDPPGKSPKPSPPQKEDPITRDIEKWLNQEPLREYDLLRRWMNDYLQSAIDWEAYGIAPSLVRERLRPPRLEIEGQNTRAPRDSIRFERSDEMGFVLQALNKLNTKSALLEPGKIGLYLLKLESWRQKEEERIVAFVGKIGRSKVSSPLSLLVASNLLVASLAEELSVSKNTTNELYLALAKSPTSESEWDALLGREPQPRSVEWRKVQRKAKGLTTGATKSKNIRDELLQLINRTQRGSQKTYFLDAALMLDAIINFREGDWHLGLMNYESLQDGSGDIWQAAGVACDYLRDNFGQALQAEKAGIDDVYHSLVDYIGTATPLEVFEAISRVLADFRKHGVPYSFQEDGQLTYRKLQNRLNSLEALLQRGDREALILDLSGSGDTLQDARRYLAYFERFLTLIERESQRQAEKIAILKQETRQHTDYEKALKVYKYLERRLAMLIPEEVGK